MQLILGWTFFVFIKHLGGYIMLHKLATIAITFLVIVPLLVLAVNGESIIFYLTDIITMKSGGINDFVGVLDDPRGLSRLQNDLNADWSF